MPGAELIVLGFGPDEEAGDPPELPERAESVTASGEQLVDVALMPGVPDELVARRIEHPMQGDRELRRTEARADVAAGLLDRVHRVRADLAAELGELLAVERPEVGGSVDPLEEGHPCVV